MSQITTTRSSPFLNRVRAAIRVRHYSIRTEKAYLGWIKRFIYFHDRKHPESMREPEVVAFLSHLAVSGNVAASTQNQALNAPCFLYKAVLESPLGDLNGAVRAKRPQKLPVVLSDWGGCGVTQAPGGPPLAHSVFALWIGASHYGSGAFAHQRPGF